MAGAPRRGTSGADRLRTAEMNGFASHTFDLTPSSRSWLPGESITYMLSGRHALPEQLDERIKRKPSVSDPIYAFDGAQFSGIMKLDASRCARPTTGLSPRSRLQSRCKRRSRNGCTSVYGLVRYRLGFWS